MNRTTKKRAVEFGLLARLAELGITTVRDTTRADSAWIDTAAAVTEGDHRAEHGAGRTRPAARIAAILGALETAATRWTTAEEWLLASPARLEATGYDVWAWPAFTGHDATADEQETTCWRRGTRLTLAGGQVVESGLVWLPADLVYVGGERPAEVAAPVATAGRAGLAVHFERPAAIAKGLNRLATGHAVGAAGRRRATPTRIDPQELSPDEAALVRRYAQAGTPVELTMQPTAFGLPLFAASRHTAAGRRVGYGLAPQPARALRNALLQLAVGGRPYPEGESLVPDRAPQVPWRAVIESFGRPKLDAVECVAIWMNALARAGSGAVAVVDLPARPGIRAVRVIAPGIAPDDRRPPVGEVVAAC